MQHQLRPYSTLSHLIRQDVFQSRYSNKQPANRESQAAQASLTELLKKNAPLRQLLWQFKNHTDGKTASTTSPSKEVDLATPTDEEIEAVTEMLAEMSPGAFRQMLQKLSSGFISPLPEGAFSTGSYVQVTTDEVSSRDDVLSLEDSKLHSPQEDKASQKHKGIPPDKLEKALSALNETQIQKPDTSNSADQVD